MKPWPKLAAAIEVAKIPTSVVLCPRCHSCQGEPGLVFASSCAPRRCSRCVFLCSKVPRPRPRQRRPWRRRPCSPPRASQPLFHAASPRSDLAAVRAARSCPRHGSLGPASPSRWAPPQWPWRAAAVGHPPPHAPGRPTSVHRRPVDRSAPHPVHSPRCGPATRETPRGQPGRPPVPLPTFLQKSPCVSWYLTRSPLLFK